MKMVIAHGAKSSKLRTQPNGQSEPMIEKREVNAVYKPTTSKELQMRNREAATKIDGKDKNKTDSTKERSSTELNSLMAILSRLKPTLSRCETVNWAELTSQNIECSSCG